MEKFELKRGDHGLLIPPENLGLDEILDLMMKFAENDEVRDKLMSIISTTLNNVFEGTDKFRFQYGIGSVTAKGQTEAVVAYALYFSEEETGQSIIKIALPVKDDVIFAVWISEEKKYTVH